MSDTFNNVNPGDMVHYLTPQGQNGRGKVVIKHESGSHVVVNRGKGQPQVVNDRNYVKHERGGKVLGAVLSRVAQYDKNAKTNEAIGDRRTAKMSDDFLMVDMNKLKAAKKTDAKLKAIKKASRNYTDARRVAKSLRNEGAGIDMRGSVVPLQALAADRKRKEKDRRETLAPKFIHNNRWRKPGADKPQDPLLLRKHAQRLGVPAKNSMKQYPLPRTGTDELDSNTPSVKATYDLDPKVKAKLTAKLLKREEVELTEGNIPKVHGFENFKNMAHDWACCNDRHNGGRPLLHQKTVETDKVIHQTLSIGHHQHSGNPYVIGVFNHLGGPNSETGHGTHHHHTQGLGMHVDHVNFQNEDSHDAEGSSARVAKTKRKKKLNELSNKKLTNYVTKAIADRRKAGRDFDIASKDQYAATPAQDKSFDRITKRSKGIGKAVGKIADRVFEVRNEREANILMANNNPKSEKGHYLMRDGRKLSGPHTPDEAMKAYKDLGGTDPKGIKIVHVKEGVETDVTSLKLSEDKMKKAAAKAISLVKKAKGNKHVDTKPRLDLADRSETSTIEDNHQEENDGKL